MSSERLALALLLALGPSLRAQSTTRNHTGCADAPAHWIWCDDFEVDRSGRYFEYDSAGGRFTRVPGAGRDGSWGMRARYQQRVSGAGHLSLAMGRTPHSIFRPVDDGRTTYRDIYWRMYIRLQAGWTGGGGDKLSRVIVMATPAWAEAAAAHVWSEEPSRGVGLMLDPASGTDPAGALRTTKYNDFANLRWLGQARGHDPIFDPARNGSWICVEFHARLNDPGQSNGLFELWVDGVPDARALNLNFLGSYSEYGWNVLNLENFWSGGPPKEEERYFDDLVVATARIGC